MTGIPADFYPTGPRTAELSRRLGWTHAGGSRVRIVMGFKRARIAQLVTGCGYVVAMHTINCAEARLLAKEARA